MEPVGGPVPGIRSLLKEILGAFPAGLPELPTGPLALDADLASDTYSLRIPLTGTFSIPLGITALAVSDVVISAVQNTAGLSGHLAGRCAIAGQTIGVQARLPDDIVLTGQLASINLTSLVKDLCGPVLTLPGGFPAVVLPAADLTLAAGGATPSLTLFTKLADLGTAVVVVEKVGADFGSAAGFALPDDWKFSKITPLFTPLDPLKIGAPALAISSFNSQDFTFPGVQGTRLGKGISEGVRVATSLSLTGLGLGFVAKILHLDRLPLLMSVADSMANSTVSATLGQSIKVVPGVLVFDDFALSILPKTPVEFRFGCQATVTIHHDELPKLAADVALSETSTRVDLETAAPWKDPFGISGYDYHQACREHAERADPGIRRAGGRDRRRQDDRGRGAFTGDAPSFLEGKLVGTLLLIELVHDLVGLSLPGGLLDISITDFELRIVADPLGVTIGGEHFDPGLAFQGTLGFLGMEMTAKVRVDPHSGVFAHAALKDKVQFGSVLTISDTSGTGPPSATLDTTHDPLLAITGRVALLRDDRLDRRERRSAGFQFHLKQTLGAAQLARIAPCIRSPISRPVAPSSLD